MSAERTTKYVTTIVAIMRERGHATNAELLEIIRIQYPDVSITTVHRVTARLLERGALRLAPAGSDNAMRFDSNNTPHDHFMCNTCGTLRDTQLGDVIRHHIEESIGNGCSISGDLVVTGTCKQCRQKTSATVHSRLQN